MRRNVLSIVLIVATACGGALETTSDDAGTTPDASPIVDARPDAPDAAVTPCTLNFDRCTDGVKDCRLYDCRHTVLSPKAMDSFDACLNTSPCPSNCTQKAFAAFFAQDATAAALRDACLDKGKACPTTFYGYLCNDLGAIAEDHRDEMEACFALPCDDVNACLSGLFPCVRWK
jgi:hypothetical protein